MANAGGIINIAVELGPGGYDPARARRDVRAIADTLRRGLRPGGERRDDAAERGDGPRREPALRTLGVARREPQRVAAGRHAHRLALGGRGDEARLGARRSGASLPRRSTSAASAVVEPQRLGGERLAHVAGRVAPLQARG